MALIPITPESHGIELQMVYAGPDNFTGAPVYARAACYLHAEAGALLRRAVELAGRIGFRLRVYDAFRPSEAQWKLWAHTPDPEFLTDPCRGSPHSRGAAVDLTLVDLGGRPLDMGTDFDAFTRLSHHGNTGISAEAVRNRALLIGLMATAGWDFYRNEWWHYQLFDARRLPLLSDSVLDQPMMVPMMTGAEP